MRGVGRGGRGDGRGGRYGGLNQCILVGSGDGLWDRSSWAWFLVDYMYLHHS